MAATVHGGCTDCAKSELDVVNLPDGSWVCRDCLFTRAINEQIDGTNSCQACGTTSDLYCSDCGACEESHATECAECYNTAVYCDEHTGSEQLCNVCGNTADYAYCDEHDGIACTSCETLIRCDSGEKAYCEACYADAGETTAQIPFVIADDGNANIQGTEVRWS